MKQAIMKMSLNKKILIFLLVAVLMLITKFIFRDTTELFDGGKIVFDEILYDLSIAYIGSAMFYYLVVYFPQQKDRQNILRYTLPHTRNIYGYGMASIREMMRSANHGIKDEYTLEEIQDACQKIQPYGDAPMTLSAGQYATWMEYYYNYSQRINDKADKVTRYAYFLDSEYIKHINTVTDSHFLRQLSNFIFKGTIANTDISFLSSAIYEFQKDFLQLKIYIEKNYG